MLQEDRALSNRVQDLLGHVIGGIRQHSVACLRHQIDAGGVRAHGVRGLPRDAPHHLLQLQGGSDRPPDAENRLRGTQAAAHLARRRRAIDGEGDAVSKLTGAATLRVSDRGRPRVQDHQADDGVIADEGDEEHGADPEALPLVGDAGIRRDGDDQPGTPAAQHLHQDRRPLRADLRLERLEGLPEIGPVRTGRELGHGRNENVALRHEDRAAIDRTRFGRDTGEAAEHRGEAWCQALPARELDLSKRDGAAVQKGPACVGGGVHAVVAGHHESMRRLRCTICGQAQRARRIFIVHVASSFPANESVCSSRVLPRWPGFVVLRKLKIFTLGAATKLPDLDPAPST